MGPVTDYNLGKARIKELEAEARRYILREEALNHVNAYPLVVKLSMVCVLVGVVLWIV